MRTKTSIQNLATSFLSVWSNKWHYFPHKPCLICILRSAHLQHSLKGEVRSDSLAALKPLWIHLTYLPPITLGRVWLLKLLLLPGKEGSKFQQQPVPVFPGNAPAPPTQTSSLKNQHVQDNQPCTVGSSMNPAQAASLELWWCSVMSGSENNLVYLLGLQEKYVILVK